MWASIYTVLLLVIRPIDVVHGTQWRAYSLKLVLYKTCRFLLATRSWPRQIWNTDGHICFHMPPFNYLDLFARNIGILRRWSAGSNVECWLQGLRRVPLQIRL